MKPLIKWIAITALSLVAVVVGISMNKHMTWPVYIPVLAVLSVCLGYSVSLLIESAFAYRKNKRKN